jgi:hypothetical protein
MHKLTIFRNALHTLAVVLLFGLYLSLGAPPAMAEDFCAITLKVTGPKGEPVTNTWIELVDPSGRVVLRERTQGSEHRICDFGFGPHTLRVGTNEFLPVAVSNLRLMLGAPQILHVILDARSYGHPMRSGCFVYFRTVDEDRKSLPGVSFSPQLNIKMPSTTDGFGRWQGLFGGAHDLTFTKPGFAETATHIECKADEEVDVEVVMRKRGTPEH